MIELSEDEYEKVLPIVEAMNYNNTVFAIIDKTQKGKIWLDKKNKPTIALLWDLDRCFFLVGDFSNKEMNEQLRQILEIQIFDFGREKRLTQWTFHFYPYEWKDILQKLIAEELPIVDYRLYYCFNKEECELTTNWQGKIQDGFKLELINSQFFTNYKHKENFKDIEDEISKWSSREIFLQYGWSYCLVNDSKIAAWCLGEYSSPSKKTIEVGIETYPEFQKQGFATVVGAAMVEYSIKKGYKIGWHCWESNVPSAKTAEKIGYKLGRKYPVLFGWYNKIDNLMVNAHIRIKYHKEFKKALGFYQQVINYYNLKDESFKSSHLFKSINEINIAIGGCYAQLNEIDIAFKFLLEAIENGFSDFERLQNSELLAPLKTDLKWKEIIDKITSKK